MSRINEKADELRRMHEDLGDIEMQVLTNFTLADAIREGCKVSEKAEGWGDGAYACGMTAAVVSARSRGYL